MIFLKILVGLIALAVVVFIAAVAYDIHKQHAYEGMVDTHDSQAQVNRLASAYVASRPNAALVIAVTQRGKRYTLGLGKVSAEQSTPPDGSTLFEIGSITKVFTAATLAMLVERGAVSLDDPISRFLPASVVSPSKNGREITLGELATQTSGLPRLPDNMLANVDLRNPYANYHVADLYRDLGATTLRNEPGTTYSYSNFGFSLLGHLLALEAGKPYETLVEDTICVPLGLSSTAFTLTPTLRTRLAPGHDVKGNVVPNWDQDATAQSGALKSDTDDLLRFIEANLQESDSGLARPLALTRQIHFKSLGRAVGLAWQIHHSVEHQTILWHNGATGGYCSFLGFDPDTKIGVVVLSSYGDAMVGDNSVDKIGMEILHFGSKVSLASR